MEHKKILTFIYTIDEKMKVEEITKIKFLDKYLKENTLDNLVKIVLFNNYRDENLKEKASKIFNSDIKIWKDDKKLKRSEILYKNLDLIETKYFKLIKPKDKIIFSWLKNLIYELTNTNRDLIQHSYYKKYKSGEQKDSTKKLNLTTYNTIFKTSKAIENKELLKTKIETFDFQYIGMALGVNSNWKFINIPYLVYDNKHQREKRIDSILIEKHLKSLDILIDFYNDNYKNIDKSFKPIFLKYALNKRFYKSKTQYYLNIRKKIKVKRFAVKAWIFFAIYFTFNWNNY